MQVPIKHSSATSQNWKVVLHYVSARRLGAEASKIFKQIFKFYVFLGFGCRCCSTEQFFPERFCSFPLFPCCPEDKRNPAHGKRGKCCEIFDLQALFFHRPRAKTTLLILGMKRLQGFTANFVQLKRLGFGNSNFNRCSVKAALWFNLNVFFFYYSRKK